MAQSLQTLQVEGQNSETYLSLRAHEQRAARRTVLVALLGVMCVSMVLLWPGSSSSASPAAAFAGGAMRIAGKSALRPAAAQDPTIQFQPGLASPFAAPKPRSSSQARSKGPPVTPFNPEPQQSPQIALQAAKTGALPKQTYANAGEALKALELQKQARLALVKVEWYQAKLSKPMGLVFEEFSNRGVFVASKDREATNPLNVRPYSDSPSSPFDDINIGDTLVGVEDEAGTPYDARGLELDPAIGLIANSDSKEMLLTFAKTSAKGENF